MLKILEFKTSWVQNTERIYCSSQSIWGLSPEGDHACLHVIEPRCKMHKKDFQFVVVVVTHQKGFEAPFVLQVSHCIIDEEGLIGSRCV